MSSDSLKARLKEGRDKPVRQGHPWIFTGAIEGWNREPAGCEAVDVYAEDGSWLARGFANAAGNLAVRLYTWKEDQALDDALFAARLDTAIALREKFLSAPDTNACRLVFSESDGISGLIVDRYADVLAVQVGAAGLVPRLPALLQHLAQRTGLKRIIVSCDKEAAARESLDSRAIAAHSTEPGANVQISENGFRFNVQVGAGHKTGFYLDQRDNRARVARYAAGRRVLSCYCYTGGFEVYASRAGAAHITGVDSSGPALALAREHHKLNGSSAPVDYIEGDVGESLRRFRDAGRKFDLVILDPPRFVSNATQKEKGMRAYKDINLLGLKLLTPGGVLATFSCSGLISLDDLKMSVRWAAKDAARTVRVLESLSQPPDHPVALAFPESEYLCGMICHAE